MTHRIHTTTKGFTVFAFTFKFLELTRKFTRQVAIWSLVMGFMFFVMARIGMDMGWTLLFLAGVFAAVFTLLNIMTHVLKDMMTAGY